MMKDLVLQIEASIEASISTSSSPSPASASHGPSSDHNIVAKQNAIIYLVLLFIRVISLYSSSSHFLSLSLSCLSLSLSCLSLYSRFPVLALATFRFITQVAFTSNHRVNVSHRQLPLKD